MNAENTQPAAAAEVKPANRRAAARTAATQPAAHSGVTAAASAGNRIDKPGKPNKPTLVRDSFTMPENEYAAIAAMKKRCLGAGVPAKKSEILRAAIASLAKSSDTALLAAIRRLEVIKTGRPKGSK